MINKTVVITGANDGIGYETAHQLARKGARIIIVCRNEQKASAAVERIKSETDNLEIEFVLADLLSRHSIQDAAGKIRQRTDRVDVLINNAGATFTNFELTEDGLEKTIAINHFAYFLLTGLLLDLIKKSDYARIVNVASDSHYRGSINFESFKKNEGYFIMKAYGQSKLANVLFTFELAERLKETHITVNCLHPGTIKTNIGSKPAMNWFHSFVWSLSAAIIGNNAKQGAKTSVYLAASDEIRGVTGKYFVSNDKLNRPTKTKSVKTAPKTFDLELRKRLWEVSEQYSGYAYPF